MHMDIPKAHNAPNPPRPMRPFGVSLAIFVSVMLYSVLPLMQVGLVLLVANHFRNREDTLTLPSGEEITEFASGGDIIGGISDERVILQGILAVGFLVIAVLAWRGKPAYTRFLLMGAVLVMTAITILLTVLPALQSGGRGVSGGSLDAISLPVLCLQFTASVLVPLYVIWYLNRAPARAFYRGRAQEPNPDTVSLN
ncbi:MAG: hypothetical protein OHK0046_27220 [Anaerolineae bacterium]